MAGVALIITGVASGQDWPQWRGVNRDGKVSGFNAPQPWPKELTRKWRVTVGEGASTPALVGGKLYVFSRQDGHEITRCLDATTGKELWQDKYESPGASGHAESFSGPRSSPTVMDGKVVTLGVRGKISCLDAATGKPLWRKADFKSFPVWFPASSPLVMNGLCIAQLGGNTDGALVAYDLTTGEQKWKWDSGSPGYASPALMKVGGTQFIIAETQNRLAAVNATDGKLVWEIPYPAQGPGNASTPVVAGETLIFGGASRGTRAFKFEKTAAGLTGTELWRNMDKSVWFNTPVLKDGLLYAFSAGNELFCLNASDGQTAWIEPFGKGNEVRPGLRPAGVESVAAGAGSSGSTSVWGPGRRPATGYASIVDVGSVLIMLTPAAQLVIFKPDDKAYTEVVRITVADTHTYAHPVISDSRIFIRDWDSVTLWRIE